MPLSYFHTIILERQVQQLISYSTHLCCGRVESKERNGNQGDTVAKRVRL